MVLALLLQKTLRNLLLRPPRQGALSTNGVRARSETAQTGTQTGKTGLLLLLLGLLEVESGQTDGAVVLAALGLRVGRVGRVRAAVAAAVHGHAVVGDVDALVAAVAVLRLHGDVEAAGSGRGDLVGRAVEGLCGRGVGLLCLRGGRCLLLGLLLLGLLLEVGLRFEGGGAHVWLLLGHLGLGLRGGEVEGQGVGVAGVQDGRRRGTVELAVLAGAGANGRDGVLRAVALESAHG